jgi:hypothetical protein
VAAPAEQPSSTWLDAVETWRQAERARAAVLRRPAVVPVDPYTRALWQAAPRYRHIREEATQRLGLAPPVARKRTPRSPKDTAGPPGGRLQPGEDHPSARLTEDAVRSIRRRHAAGEGRAVLAQEYGVSPRSINLIASRRKWQHVTDPPHPLNHPQPPESL